ncbi:MAG: carboxypeptidase-like regulatory domain-containing protein, partial [Holophagales bacterium]|nr:carboxypeptidase-like regulatory domain-containing protein [Holophagales bacterium]
MISAHDGAPVPGAWVWRPERAAQAARTGEDGRFLLHAEPGETVAGSSLRLLLAAPGYLHRRTIFQAREPGREQSGGTSSAEGMTSPGDGDTLTLWPAAAVSGEVVGADGSPRADVAIHAPRRLAGPYRDRGPATYTDAEGRFHAGGLEPGVELELDFVRDDLRHVVHPVAALRPFEHRRGLRLLMDAAALVIGRVVDPELRPLAGATVELDGSAQRRGGSVRPAELGGDDDTLEVSTDRDGRFAAALTRGGLLDLEIRRPGFAPLRLEAVAASDAEDRVDLGELVLEPASPVFGQVVDTEGQAVAGAEVYTFSRAFERWEELELYLRFRRPVATSDAGGHFHLDALHAGESLDLVVRRAGFARALISGVTAPTAEP